MKTLIYYVLIGILSSTVLSCNRSSDSVKRAERTNDSVFGKDINKGFLNDADFVVTAFNIGLTEIKIGNIAQKNGLDQGVKDLGKQAVENYTRMNETLTALATKKNITLPTELGKKSNKEVNEISGRSGNIFDRAYTDLMIKKRAREIRTFEEAEKKASDLDIKTFASETLPMFRKQLAATEELKLRIPYY